jgi:hypothetical protein
MLPSDYEAVRHEHSARSGDLILNKPVDWGLPAADPALAELVGLVAMAHGTKYYRKTIPLLEQRTRVREERVRGPLLAALLLMADEFDLFYRREVNVPGEAQLNAVSEAHAFKHRCISSASTHISQDGTIHVDLTLSISDDISRYARADIERWIVWKLRRQMALVDPEITQGFARYVRLDRAIGVTYVSSLSPRRPPSDQALAVIRSEVATDDLIDHRDKLRRTETALSGGHAAITGKWAAETLSDTHGREDLFMAIVARFLADSSVVIASSRRLHDLGSGEVSDVLEEWVRDLDSKYEAALFEQESEVSARTRLLDACVAAIEGMDNNKLLILAIACFDGLSDEGIRWLTNTAIPRIAQARNSVRLLITADGEGPVPTIDPLISVIPTDEIDRSEVVDYLRGVGLEDAETLADSELPYYSLKRICNRKLVSLQGQGS